MHERSDHHREHHPGRSRGGDRHWFGPAGSPSEVDQSDHEQAIREQREAADAFLVGRVTYEQMRSYWPQQTDDITGITDYLNKVNKYVVSSTLLDPQWDPTTVLRGAPEPSRSVSPWQDLGRALACWAAFVASVALMPVVGFPIAFAFLTWFIVAVMARQPQRTAWAVAIGGSALFYAIFEFGLDLSLPRGMLY